MKTVSERLPECSGLPETVPLQLYEALLLLQRRLGSVLIDGHPAADFPTHSPAGLEFYLKNRHVNGPGVGPMDYYRICEDVQSALQRLFQGSHILSDDARRYPAFLSKKS